MRIYFSGIGGFALCPLAQIAVDAGNKVSGSDAVASPMTRRLEDRGVSVYIGQTGAEIAQEYRGSGIDWIVVSSSIPANHPEVEFARRAGIRISKRDELLNVLIAKHRQKLIAVSGTHGKTTTTAMLIWACRELGFPVSYSVGANIAFGPSGYLSRDASYFVYEADEYDKNMLSFRPHAAVITSVDYDHPDTYPTVEEYKEAFRDFVAQSVHTFLWRADRQYLGLTASDRISALGDETVTPVRLRGAHNRRNAMLAIECMRKTVVSAGVGELVDVVNRFPGTCRRFERLSQNLYSDYAHHPTEIAAVVQHARELSGRVVVVYQPHQNIRQHEVIDMYKDCFDGAEHVFWLPTHLSRENPLLPVLSPMELIAKLGHPAIAEPAALDYLLVERIAAALSSDALVVCMGAGSIDGWLRENLWRIGVGGADAAGDRRTAARTPSERAVRASMALLG